MTDKSHVRFKNQRNEEPTTIDTDNTGTNATGNYLNGGKMGLPNPDHARDIWIEQEDQAKQGMARRDDLSRAQAAPGHPYIRDSRGGGESQ
ncbi:MAG: hypothetical protein K0R39_1815 [Symbiobacteriaceae bacterium]|jgi:hypothetical protein|nr:hypothetical protein [Symbiobacteriaceae bacterium]